MQVTFIHRKQTTIKIKYIASKAYFSPREWWLLGQTMQKNPQVTCNLFELYFRFQKLSEFAKQSIKTVDNGVAVNAKGEWSLRPIDEPRNFLCSRLARNFCAKRPCGKHAYCTFGGEEHVCKCADGYFGDPYVRCEGKGFPKFHIYSSFGDFLLVWKICTLKQSEFLFVLIQVFNRHHFHSSTLWMLRYWRSALQHLWRPNDQLHGTMPLHSGAVRERTQELCVPNRSPKRGSATVCCVQRKCVLDKNCVF